MNEKIETLVKELMNRYGISSAAELCDYMGVKVLSQDLPDATKGFSLRIKDVPIIVLNQEVTERDRGYVLAHELGHLLLHHTMNHFFLKNQTNLCWQRLENEADYFAACLLLYGRAPQDEMSENLLTYQQFSAACGLPEHVLRLRFH